MSESRTAQAWTLAWDALTDAERTDVRTVALDALAPLDRANVDLVAQRLAKNTRALGYQSALHLLAVIGGLLAEHPEWGEVAQ